MDWRRWLVLPVLHGVLVLEAVLTTTAHPPEDPHRGFAGVDEESVTPPATFVGINAPGVRTVGGTV